MNSLQRVWNCKHWQGLFCSKVQKHRPSWSPTWIHWRLSRKVLATDFWWMPVGSCLQCIGASAIWLVNHWRHLTSSTRISVWPCRTPGPWNISTWCSASSGGYRRRQKANNGQLEKTAGSPSQRLAQQCPGTCQHSTAMYAVKMWDRHSPGAMERRSCSLRVRDDDDDDDDDDGCRTCVKNGG